MLFEEYKKAQYCFDKRRQIERQFHKEQLLKFDGICTENPIEFWKHIRYSGPRKNKPISEKIWIGNELTSDFKLVREKWTADFKQLYNRPVENENER